MASLMGFLLKPLTVVGVLLVDALVLSVKEIFKSARGLICLFFVHSYLLKVGTGQIQMNTYVFSLWNTLCFLALIRASYLLILKRKVVESSFEKGGVGAQKRQGLSLNGLAEAVQETSSSFSSSASNPDGSDQCISSSISSSSSSSSSSSTTVVDSLEWLVSNYYNYDSVVIDFWKVFRDLLKTFESASKTHPEIAILQKLSTLELAIVLFSVFDYRNNLPPRLLKTPRSGCASSCLPPLSKSKLDDAIECAKWADLAYLTDEDAIEAKLVASGYSLAVCRVQQGSITQHRPAHFIAIHNTKKILLVAIRGTATLDDVFTDLITQPTPLLEGDSDVYLSHSGMTFAARFILSRLMPFLSAGIVSDAKFNIIITGHSLGGGTAALLASILILEGKVPKSQLQTFTYGSPAVADPNLAAISKEFVTAFVNGHDIIPRASPSAGIRIFQEYQSNNLGESLINRLKEHSLVQMAQRVGALTQPACPLDTLFKSVNVSNQIDTHLREYNESVSSSETSSIIFRPTVPGRIFVVGRDCMGWSGVLDERPDVVEQCELSAFLVSDHSIATGYLAELEKCRSIIYGT